MRITFIKTNNFFDSNPRNNNLNIDQSDPIYQPDIFEPYTQSEQTRQSRQPFPLRQNSISYNKNFQSQNPMNTQNYQPNQLQNENPLP